VDTKTMAVVAALLLGGCSTVAPAIIAEPKETLTPVVKKCVEKSEVPEIPQFPLDAVDLSNEKEALARLTNAARLERKVRMGYLATVNKVLVKCSE
jgi:PBP1b-binding outer membrane lipoprotein LpoB